MASSDDRQLQRSKNIMHERKINNWCMQCGTILLKIYNETNIIKNQNEKFESNNCIKFQIQNGL